MKTLLKVIAALVVLVMVLIGVVAVVLGNFDPNDHKDDIIAKVREGTGRDLKLEGDIKLSFYPWLGLEANGVTLGNAPGFGDAPFLRAGHLHARAKLLPLLGKTVEMDTIRLEGAEVNLARNQAGVNNWDDLIQGKGKEEEQAKPLQLAALAIGGVDIKDAKLSWSDATQDQVVKVTGLNVGTGSLTLGEPIKLNAVANVEANKPSITGVLALDGTVAYELDKGRFTLKPFETIGQFKGKNLPGGAANLHFTTAVDINLDAETAAITDINLDVLGANLRGAVNAAKIKSAGPAVTGDLAVKGADLAFIFHALEIEPLASQLAKLADPSFALSAKFDADMESGVLQVPELTTRLLGATITGNLRGDKAAFEGALKVAPFDLRKLLTQLNQKLPPMADANALQKVAVDAKLSGAANSLAAKELTVLLDDTQMKGELAVNHFKDPDVTFDITVDGINADRYLSPREQGSKPVPVTPEAAAAAATTLPVETLRALKVKGDLSVGRLVISNLKLNNVKLAINAHDGKIAANPIVADLYQGAYKGAIDIDATGKTARLSLDSQLQGIQAEPLLTDLNGKSRLRGRGDLAAQFSATGGDTTAMKHSLTGRTKLAFKEGAIKGINIGKLLRSLESGMVGVNETESTDFTEIGATVVCSNGLCQNQDLAMKSPLLRVGGAGTVVNLATDQIDYSLRATLVGTATGEGGAELEKLKGVTIPIKISGTTADPKFKPDFGKIAKEQLQRQIEKRLGTDKQPNGEDKKDTVKDAVKKLLKF